MLKLILEVVLGPIMVAGATVAARRFGEQRGGLLTGFPAIVGPVLLIDAQQHGARFAAQSATATLGGLVALCGFTVAYGRAAGVAGWRVSLITAWIAAATLAAVLTTLRVSLIAALLLTATSLGLALWALPPERLAVPAGTGAPRGDLAWRMSLTAVLILALVGAAGALGPTVGGALAALPALASVLAVVTHVQRGCGQVRDLLRGILRGTVGFGLFCLLVGALVQPAGVAPAFVLATGGAIVAQFALAKQVSRPAASEPVALGGAHTLAAGTAGAAGE
jgi:hypothetical protein